MATSSLTAANPRLARSVDSAMPVRVMLSALLSVAGVFSIFSTCLFLWSLWTTDPLKSIGGFVPLVSLILILRVWHALGWQTRGTWWGLLLLAGTIALVHIRDHAILEFVVSPSWSIFFPPHSLVVLAYVSGAVLLFGGARLYRAALFPIVLTWFVNPVPHVFNRFVDLPLQHASAATARAFAHELGQKLTPDQLFLMFTPDFGMFIAPGCNGIRGSLTMGFIALIAAYLYRFRLRTSAMVVTAAVLLGYAFNLLRLCVLVVYYVIALHLPSLQGHAELADYFIGAALFFFATMSLFAVIRRFNPNGSLRPPRLQIFSQGEPARLRSLDSFWLRWAAFAGIAMLGSVSYVRGLAQPASHPVQAQAFPRVMGAYGLRRTWDERLSTGQTIFAWADYAVPGANSAVSVGVSPVLGAHDTLLCHAARGEDWAWHGTVALPTTMGLVSFSASFFNDGATQYIEASTVCSGESCGQFGSERQHFGFVYSHPDTRSLLAQSPSRPIPILLRVETPDATINPEVARRGLLAQLQSFLSGADLAAFTRPYRQP